MILTDTGAIFALLNHNDLYHSRCVEVVEHMPDEQRMITTLPCVTESMHFLGDTGGYAYQARLWDLVKANQLVIHQSTPAEITRMAQLMEQ